MNALEIINNVEILNQDQYEIVVAYDKENDTDLVYTYLNDISYPSGPNRWLNINVYSERSMICGRRLDNRKKNI